MAIRIVVAIALCSLVKEVTWLKRCETYYLDKLSGNKISESGHSVQTLRQCSREGHILDRKKKKDQNQICFFVFLLVIRLIGNHSPGLVIREVTLHILRPSFECYQDGVHMVC